MSAAQCTNTCGNLAVSTAEVFGTVKDSSGAAIKDATVRAFGVSVVTDATGAYQLKDLPTGDVTVRVSHALFEVKQTSATLTGGERKQIDFQLVSLGTGGVRGTVTSVTGVTISGAQVIVRRTNGQSAGQGVTDVRGEYIVGGLAFGEYTVSVTASGYQTQTSSIQTSSALPLSTTNFQLIVTQEGIVNGQVIDQSTGAAVPFARIHVNGVFVRHGGTDGLFVLQLPASSTGISYVVSVQHPDFQSSPAQTLLLKTGDRATPSFALVPILKECVHPIAKAVENFAAQHVEGEQSIRLSWAKPCNEAAGYIINRTTGARQANQTTIASVDVVPGNHPLAFVDSSVEWGTAYEYSIIALYTDVQPRSSEKKTARITTGDSRCEGRHNGFELVEFCDPTGRLRQICTGENQVTAATSPGPADCSVLGATFHCSNTGADVTCKDAGICTSVAQNANPFGLWFTRFSCYGLFNPTQERFTNFCTFDQTATIFDACIACSDVKSCFGYKGKDACTVNNCAVGNCTWVDSIPELGAGYCVDTSAKDTFGTQHCARCGASAESSLFTNAACTGQVCTALGACYAKPDSSACLACNDQSSCYDFGTEAECSLGENAQFVSGKLRPSEDACTLQRCSWDGQQCVKDGNGDGQDDCASFTGDAQRCHKDNKAPRTIVSPDIIRIGDLTDQVRFSARDDSSPAHVYYCVDRTNDCLPNSTSFRTFGGDGGASIDAGALGLSTVYNRSPIYFVRYFSEDVFSNREDIQSKRFTADLDAPTINVNYTVNLQPSGSTILFTIILDEPATCKDALFRRGGQQQLSKISGGRNSSFIVMYSNQSDGSYSYNVSCTDDFENTAYRAINVLDLDALNFISVTSPLPAMSELTFPFIVQSTDPADCELFDGTTRVESLTSSDHFTHRSTPKTFTANIFHAQWRAVCTELSSGERHEKFIPFTIDKQPPRTTIELVSDDGIVQKYDVTNWTAFMSTVSRVNFVCDDFPQEAGESVGFGCKETLHCIARPNESRCIPASAGTFPSLQNSSTICFFSSDNGGSRELEKCGKVTLTPSFGIELARPRFGISPLPQFDLLISTRAPSAECKWVGAPSGGAVVAFNYTNLVTASNIFHTVNPNLFEIKKFNTLLNLRDGVPAPIIIRCLSSSGVVSPPQPFTIGYDTTAPQIRVARAEPESVSQGNSVDLVVETDEPTLCKYGKKAGAADQSSSFPGFEQSLFTLEHRTTHILTTRDDGQTHEFNVSCINRAENRSSTARIRFAVDFSVGGTITSLEPRGALSSSSVTLIARTNKDAFCEIAESNGTSLFYQQFSSTGGIMHSNPRGNLTEGNHAFHIKCSFFAPTVTRDAILNFTIDRTPPTINSADDGNVSCSGQTHLPTVNAADTHSSVIAYDYQLFEKPTTLVGNGTMNATNATLNTNMTVGKDYFFKLKPIDAAGNVGRESSTDGFTIIAANSSKCLDGQPPVLTISQNAVRTGTVVNVSCTDENGCASVKYGTSERQESCLPTQSYLTAVIIQKNSFFCVLAMDTAGNPATRNEEIKVADKDDDGVTDTFDNCPDTPSGQEVDDKGCASAQLLTDGDKDGLDDSWELRHDEGTVCALDPRNPDTDGDGVNDGDEDYDGDGMDNVEEMKARSDPCAAVAPPTISDPPPSDGSPGGTDEEASPLAGLFIIFGLFLAFGGGAYLGYVHYYQKRVTARPSLPQHQMSTMSIARPTRPVQRMPPEIQQAAIQRQEARRETERQRRSLLFSAFGGAPDAEKKKVSIEKRPEQKQSSAFERLSKLTRGTPDSDTLTKLKNLAQKGKRK
jgi:hypothetical protein